MRNSTHHDYDGIMATVANGASISDDADTLEVGFDKILVEVHYWAEPTSKEDGVNRPDYDDEINVFAKTKNEDGLMCDKDRADIASQCLERMRSKFIEESGLNLTFSSKGLL